MSKIAQFNVLLAEDEPLLLHSLERHIQNLDLGFRVVCKASNGQEAWELVNKNEIHLVITDIIMPVMSGLDLLERISRHIPNTAVVIISGHADFEFAQQSIREGALDYILKPITKDKIESMLMKAKFKLSQHYQLIEDESLSGPTAEKTMEHVRDYIRNNYAQQIDLSSIASNLGISSAYLTKLFSKYEKCSPIKYLTDLRIAEAKHLLFNTELTIKEVGEKVGYPNQFYFSRVFRKMNSLSPSEFRAALKDQNE